MSVPGRNAQPSRSFGQSPWHWLRVFNTPELAQTWDVQDWQTIVRQARRLRLLARLGHQLQSHRLWPQVPTQAQALLRADMVLSAWRTRALFWALEHVATCLDYHAAAHRPESPDPALPQQPYPKLLLKGAAYLAQGLPIAAGRLPSDLDILVPQPLLAHAQQALQQAGWSGVTLDAHDQHYYDAWSHEVPPMRHPLHPMELDLHHNILPPIARTHVDGALLLAFAAENPIPPPPGQACPPGWSVLHPVDQVLHASVHLVVDSDLQARVRDLVDLDGLIRVFSQHPWFWPALLQRAEQLHWQRPLLHALGLAHAVMGTPVADDAWNTLKRSQSFWQRAKDSLLLPMMLASLNPGHPDRGPSIRSRIATTLLLARYHRQRLPLRLLVPHLLHKLRASGETLDPQIMDPKAEPSRQPRA